jgi:hypothetical protein
LSNSDCPHDRVPGNCPICAKLGATGEFPDGKVNEDDEGGLMCAVGDVGDTVRIDFGPKPVAWLALDPDAAIAFATAIIDRAMAIKTRGAKAMMEAFGETKQ